MKSYHIKLNNKLRSYSGIINNRMNNNIKYINNKMRIYIPFLVYLFIYLFYCRFLMMIFLAKV